MKVLKSQKGNISILMAFALTGLMAFMAFVVDIGEVYIERVKLSNGLDAAALAAGMDLLDGEDAARATAIEYLQLNDISLNEVIIDIDADRNEIVIYGKRGVNHIFAPLVGIDYTDVNASTKAVMGPIVGISKGVRPYAVEMFDYEFGDQVILKSGADLNYNGNFGAIALGGTGTSNLRQNTLYGYNGLLRIGDIIDTEPGNMVSVISDLRQQLYHDGSTYDNLLPGTERVWTIPLVDTMDVDGRNSITILGFAQFFIEGVRNSGGHQEIVGRFMQFVADGEIDVDAPSNGLYGVKLVN